jgi:hypothetical protein
MQAEDFPDSLFRKFDIKILVARINQERRSKAKKWDMGHTGRANPHTGG